MACMRWLELGEWFLERRMAGMVRKQGHVLEEEVCAAELRRRPQ